MRRALQRLVQIGWVTAAVSCSSPRAARAPASAAARQLETAPAVPHTLHIRAGDTAYAIAPDGTLESTTTDDGASLTRPAPLFSVRVGGRWFRVTTLTRNGNVYRATFGASGVTADYAIHVAHGALVIRLTRLKGSPPQELQLAHLRAPTLDTPGPLLALRSNNRRVISIVPLDDCVHVGLEARAGITASVYPSFGMVGHAVAIASSPRQRFLESMRRIEIATGLPSPLLDGVWAKTSPDAREGYLFTDLTEANVQQTIRYARLAHLKYILIYAHTWASSLGSYPINLRSYPDGEPGLKATIAKVHAAGLKVGMHLLATLVSKSDPLVRPVPDPRLLKDAEATLGMDVSATASTIVATKPLVGFPSHRAYYGPLRKAGLDIQIDNEIIECPDVGVVDPRTFSHCRRGFAGTRASAHRAGSRIQHLAERFGSYVADLHTSLKDQIAERIAGLINRDGFDMISFDGGVVDAADGPPWHWVGQEQLAIWRRVRRPLLVTGSGITPYTWHIFTRADGGDFVALQKRSYFDSQVLVRHDVLQHSFTLSDLGWWGLLDHSQAHPATTPEDADFLGIRMLALDAPIAVETTMSQLGANRRSDEILRTLGRYNALRTSGLIRPALRSKLRAGDWHMVARRNEVEFYPIHRERSQLKANDSVHVTNASQAQPFRFTLRCLSRLAAPTKHSNLTLLRSAQLQLISPPAHAAHLPGALVRSIPLGRTANATRTARSLGVSSHGNRHRVGRNLRSHRALAITLRVTGPPDPTGTAPAVLDLQLESTSKRYRDYPIELDFRGQRTIVVPKSGNSQSLSSLTLSSKTYNVRAALSNFNFGSVVALNVRWMRHPVSPITVRLRRVVALAEAEGLARRVTMTLGGGRMSIGDLRTGDYAEYLDGDSLRVFDANGNLLRTVQVPKPLQLRHATNTLRVHAADGGRFELTSFVFGTPETVQIPSGAKAPKN